MTAPRTDDTKATRVRRGAAAILLAAAAAGPLVNVFGVSAAAGLLLGAVLPAAVLAAVLALVLRDAPPALRWAAQAFAVAAGMVYPLASAAADPFGASSLTEQVLVGPGTAWRRLLSVDLPVPFSRSLVNGAALYVALGVVLVVGIALAQRPSLGMIPAVLVFGALLTLGVGGPVSPVALAAVFLLACGLLLVATRATNGSGLNPVGVAVLALALAGGLAVAAVIPLRAPVDGRHDVARPVEPSPQNSPLAQLSAQLQRPTAQVLTARFPAGSTPTPQNWLVATYDGYTGATWTARVTAQAVSTTRRSTPAPGRDETATVTLQSPAALLPHQPGVQFARPEGARLDSGSGVLITTEPVTSYTIGYRNALPTVSQLAQASVPADVPARLRAVPACMPATLRTFATDAVAGAVLPDEQAIKLQQAFLAQPFVFDPQAAPGDGCARITEFLRSHRGTSQQFATAYALAARTLGLPARVAVGFGPGKAGTDGSVVVTNADAKAWVQIDFAGVGWTDFEPTPAGKGAFTRPRASQPALTKIGRSIQAKGPTPSAQVPQPERRTEASSHTMLYVTLAAAVALLLLFLPTVVRSVRRSRRRRVDDDADSVLNAWADALRTLNLADIETRSRTAPQIVGAGTPVVGTAGGALASLAGMAEEVLYGAGSVPDRAAGWDLANEIRRGGRHTVPVRRRVLLGLTALS